MARKLTGGQRRALAHIRKAEAAAAAQSVEKLDVKTPIGPARTDLAPPAMPPCAHREGIVRDAIGWARDTAAMEREGAEDAKSPMARSVGLEVARKYEVLANIAERYLAAPSGPTITEVAEFAAARTMERIEAIADIVVRETEGAEPVRYEYRTRHKDGVQWYPWNTPSYDNTREERDRCLAVVRADGMEAEARDLYAHPAPAAPSEGTKPENGPAWGWVCEFNDPDPQMEIEPGESCPEAWRKYIANGQCYPLYDHPCSYHSKLRAASPTVAAPQDGGTDAE